MPGPLPITDAMISREFRLHRCSGSAIDGITNPLIRRFLSLGAEARAAREAAAEPSTHRDANSRAANDND